jgi:hypothetical protein
MTPVKQAEMKAPPRGKGGPGAPKPGAVAPPVGKTDVVPVRLGDATIDFNVKRDAEGPVFFSLGVRKSGSTMLHKVINFLALRNQVNIVDIPGTFFRNGFTVANWNPLDLSELLAPGNLYSGFRAYPTELAKSALYKDALKVFMFRDPRDALVSQYFSDAYSHELPKQEAAGGGRELFLKKRDEAQRADIDEWVLEKAGAIRRTLHAYRDALADEKCLILRYEDYVFQKRRMIFKVLNHFGWTIEPQMLQKLLADIDVVPDSEDKSRFVRRVIPGDHVAKLKPETIRRLNRKLAEVMQTFDYY